MKVFQNLCASLGLLAVLLFAKSANSQLIIQPPINPATSSQAVAIRAQAAPENAEMTTANALLERVQAGYFGENSLVSGLPLRSHERDNLIDVGENLTVTIPIGWEVGFQARQGRLQILELVPEGQTIEHWQDLLTMQTILGGLSQTPSQLSNDMVSLFKRVCPNLDVSSVVTGEDNGYPFALWIQNCPNNPQVNQAEITLFKLIKGNDNWYYVHRAWHVPSLSSQQAIPISPQSLEEWGRYMHLVGVCDTRIPERKCSYDSGNH